MVFPTTLSLDKKMQSSRFRDSATSANDRVKKSGRCSAPPAPISYHSQERSYHNPVAGHILRSPLKSALKLFRNDGLSPHTKKGLLARPVKNKYKNQFGDVPFLRPNTGRAGGARTDGTTNPLDGFRGSLNGHDEVGESVPGEENGPNSADQYSSDEEDWDIDTAFSKLLQQEYALHSLPAPIFNAYIHPRALPFSLRLTTSPSSSFFHLVQTSPRSRRLPHHFPHRHRTSIRLRQRISRLSSRYRRHAPPHAPFHQRYTRRVPKGRERFEAVGRGGRI